MQGACEKKTLPSFLTRKKMLRHFCFRHLLTASASRQVADTRWTCSSLVVNQRFDWRQEVDHNQPIGACREHGLANAPQ